MYKEYQVEKIDDSALDEIKRGYKTAEETEDGKTKVNLFLYLIYIYIIYLIFHYFKSIGPFLLF